MKAILVGSVLCVVLVFTNSVHGDVERVSDGNGIIGNLLKPWKMDLFSRQKRTLGNVLNANTVVDAGEEDPSEDIFDKQYKELNEVATKLTVQLDEQIEQVQSRLETLRGIKDAFQEIQSAVRRQISGKGFPSMKIDAIKRLRNTIHTIENCVTCWGDD